MMKYKECGKIDQSVYINKGYKSRRDYLQSLAEEYDLPLMQVRMMASINGPSEDFDGLINELEELNG